MISISLDDVVIAKQSATGYAPLCMEVANVAIYLHRERTHGFSNYSFRLCPDDNCYYGKIRGSVHGLELAMADIEFFGISIKDFDRYLRPLLDD